MISTARGGESARDGSAVPAVGPEDDARDVRVAALRGLALLRRRGAFHAGPDRLLRDPRRGSVETFAEGASPPPLLPVWGPTEPSLEQHGLEFQIEMQRESVLGEESCIASSRSS